MSTQTSDQPAAYCLYCPALGAFRGPLEALTGPRAHLAERFPWIALSAFPGASAPTGWVLRAYFSEVDSAYYLSHRTMSEKIALSGKLVELYAPPGAYGNDTAGHVPPKK